MSEKRFCAVDAEGDVGNVGLLGVAIYSDREQCYLRDPDRITACLVEHARLGYTFLCHNASYDIPVVWGQLGLRPEYTYYNDRFHHGSWKWNEKRSAAQIWDTLDLSGGLSLEKLGQALGLPKYPTPQKLLGKDPDRYEWKCEQHDRWECEDCYAIRDAEICYRFMDGLSNTLAAWGVKPRCRISGIAVEVWKALDNPHSIGLTDRRIRHLARRAYYGGRTEVFKYGTIAPCYVADIQSAYPAAMIETPMPDPTTLQWSSGCRPAVFPWEHDGVAEVDISVPVCHVPPLPYSRKGERIYPVGRLRGTWTLQEIRYAMSLGATVHHVYHAAHTNQTVRPFASFIGVLWELREAYKATDDPRQLFAKLLMNNLYGRLGAREEPERMLIKPAPPGWSSFQNPKRWEPVMIGERTYLTKTSVMDFGHAWSNVLWAGSITAAVRIKLHKLMLLQGVHLAYCDTDSILSNAPIQGLCEGLGQLKMEGEFQRAIFSQPKLYALQDLEGQWRPKAKGVTREVALRFLQGHAVTFSKPVKPKEGLVRGIEPGTWLSVTKERRTDTYRRQPTTPAALLLDGGYSETDPLVNGPLI